MQSITRILVAKKPAMLLAILTFSAGVVGMAISFLFLASAHRLDVIAGAAGFVAGAILVAAGLISISLHKPAALPQHVPPRMAIDTPWDEERWARHFQRNREHRPEPNWTAPVTLPVRIAQVLVKSLEQFQLGDGGGPAYLIAHDREQFLSQSKGTRNLVDSWFAEEREHARLLGEAVTRFGGHCIKGHWSFTAFCLAREWFGVRFELTVLLLTEIVSTVYYRLLRRHSRDAALDSMCRLIIRDETGHVAFHRDRLTRSAIQENASVGNLWELRFRLLGLGAATMLWLNHGAALRKLGATNAEFYREIWVEISRFVGQLRKEIAKESQNQRQLRHSSLSEREGNLTF
jgi:hypothetical protein